MGSTYRTHIKPLVLLQKKIIRIITFSPWQAHTSELFIATKILPLQKILFLSICVLVYSELCGDCQVKFNFNSRSHNHNTRNRSKLATSLRTSNYYCRSIEHTGAQFFNFIPDHLKNQLTVHRFKSKLKFWLFHEKFDIYKLIFPHKTETNSSSSLWFSSQVYSVIWLCYLTHVLKLFLYSVIWLKLWLCVHSLFITVLFCILFILHLILLLNCIKLQVAKQGFTFGRLFRIFHW